MEKKLTKEEIQMAQMFSLCLTKLVHDYWFLQGRHSLGTEMFFEQWIEVNLYSWTEDFETDLFNAFLKAIRLRGRQKSRRQDV